jgi:hypothetical protein
MARPVRGRRGEVQAVFDLLADRPSAVNLAVHGLIHRLTHLIGGLGRIVSPFSITKVVQRVPRGADAGYRRLLARSGHLPRSDKCHNQKFATAIGSCQFVQAPQTEAAKRKPASIYSGRLSSLESVEQKRAAWAALFLLSWARTPLTIVAHILPSLRVVIRPTLAAIGSISGAHTHGADACLSTAEPAVDDVHRATAARISPRP